MIPRCGVSIGLKPIASEKSMPIFDREPSTLKAPFLEVLVADSTKQQVTWLCVGVCCAMRLSGFFRRSILEKYSIESGDVAIRALSLSVTFCRAIIQRFRRSPDDLRPRLSISSDLS